MSSNKSSDSDDRTDKDKRKRFIYQVWDRNPNGPILKRGQAPHGIRTPNGQVWGHSLADFFWIERIPGVNVRTIWSTSMLHKLDDTLFPSQKKILAAYQADFPRIVQPWPLLCAPDEEGELEILCAADEGCERGHDMTFMALRPRIVGDIFEIGPTRCRDFTPEQKKFVFSACRRRLKQMLTTGMDPTIVKNDPRWAIPDQSAPSNELPPKLEEFIPKEYLPDILLVHDPHNVTKGVEGHPNDSTVPLKADLPIRYMRTLPKDENTSNTTDENTSNTAHLYLAASNLCGRGHHSLVYHAPLTLPAPLTARTSTRQVTVLAKISFPDDEHEGLLNQEGLIYDTFPQWMMEDYCGYNVVDQIPHPVPACAIVPKFYGFYVPEDESNLSPILLLEDCGLPVSVSTLRSDDRTQLHAMFVNLNTAGFLQGSVYPRNILIQPGPLTVPPSERSLASPSFRIIDFGRALYKLHDIRDKIGEDAWERYNKWLEDNHDFIKRAGAAEVEKEYTVTVYDDQDEDGENKEGREVTMVMGLEKGEWEKLCKAWSDWTSVVSEEDRRVHVALTEESPGGG